MAESFTPSHRGGAGTPLVLLHGFTDTWRTWELVLEDLQRDHDVLAPTLPCHAGGPALERRPRSTRWPTRWKLRWTTARLPTAHFAGNSLGGYLALKMAARGRARSVVSLAPAGGWPAGDPLPAMLHEYFLRDTHARCVRAAPRAQADHVDARGPAQGHPIFRRGIRTHPRRAVGPSIWSASRNAMYRPCCNTRSTPTWNLDGDDSHLSGAESSGAATTYCCPGRARLRGTSMSGRCEADVGLPRQLRTPASTGPAGRHGPA